MTKNNIFNDTFLSCNVKKILYIYIHIYIFPKLLSQRNAEEAFRNLTTEFSFSKLEWEEIMLILLSQDPLLGEEGWLKNLLH